MKKHAIIILLAALVPSMATAKTYHHKPATVNENQIREIVELKSEIRDDYQQLEEDREDRNTYGISDDERQIAEDKARLREAFDRHGLKYHDKAWVVRDRAEEQNIDQEEFIRQRRESPDTHY